jgi:hypothetical protein
MLLSLCPNAATNVLLRDYALGAEDRSSRYCIANMIQKCTAANDAIRVDIEEYAGRVIHQQFWFIVTNPK